MNPFPLRPFVFIGILLGARSILHAAAVSLSGTIVDLSGHPLSGIQVEIAGISAVSASAGKWTITGTAGIGESPRRISALTPVSGHLVFENGRLRPRFGSANVLGHIQPKATIAPAARDLAATRAMTALTPDTIVVSWRGKRLVRLPVTSYDSTGIVFTVDTAWSDDFDIPWNSRISYSSLVDSRDGKVYRTVLIGTQTWMAENLNVEVENSWWDGFSADTGQKYGRKYQWAAAMDLAPEYNTTRWLGEHSNHKGVCPTDWHVPTDSEWTTLLESAGLNRAPVIEVSENLKSSQGWLANTWAGETDRYGFRFLPSGCSNFDCSHGYWAYTWSATERDSVNVLADWICSFPPAQYFTKAAGQGANVRCLKN